MSEILVEVTRGPIVESIHRGDVAVVDASGKLRYSVGNPGKVTYMRSSAKPIQALAVVESGAADHFGFTQRELAVMCASHAAEDFHVETVYSILQKIGVDESALKCGSHYPGHEESHNRLIREGKPATPVHNNCSGKHSGMLAVCVQMGWSIDDYFKPKHPVQQLSLNNFSQMADFPVEDIAVGVDGCGVVVWGVPISAMALAFARLADPTALPAKRRAAVERIVSAVQAHPEMISGTERFNTVLIETARPRLIAKGGAQAVFCLGHLEAGLGLALKIEDGNSRGSGPATLAILDQLDLLTPGEVARLDEFYHPKNLNVREEVVGEVRPVFELTPA